MEGFRKALEKQKERSRAAGAVQAGDWVRVNPEKPAVFVGYEALECTANVIRWRIVEQKGKALYHLVLDQTPFYAESGGQVGDTGELRAGDRRILILDTKKENELIVHVAASVPDDLSGAFTATVDRARRGAITSNHSATHLMHAGLRQVLGKHVTQKGSLVNDEVTRFDFAHFSKVSGEELRRIETLVNEKIMEDLPLEEERGVPLQQAMDRGAMALFGEKYGDSVRVITFGRDFSVELCGGTHVPSTGRIGLFRIISESAVAAGVRRVEAVTGRGALQYVDQKLDELQNIRALLDQPEPLQAVRHLLDENQRYKKESRQRMEEKAASLKKEILAGLPPGNGMKIVSRLVDLPSAEAVKTLSFDLRREVENLALLLAAEVDGKPHLSLIFSDNLVEEKKFDARTLIRELAKNIGGGGGGQPFYATAGGKNAAGLAEAVRQFEKMIG
jgi:alanyl-tRNA synthetase